MVLIEKYLGFGMDEYEAKGGLDDLLVRSDSLEKVKKALAEHKRSDRYCSYYWIIDMETFEEVDIT